MSLHIGPHGSVNGQTIGFEVRHREKHKIKFKHEGDEFTADYCCDNGFTSYFNF